MAAKSPRDNGGVVVAIYPIAGRQLFFSVPDRFCRECDLTLRLVQGVIEELGPEGHGIGLDVKPWLNNLVEALRRGGWHPPVVTINGRLFSQGVVPEKDELRAALLQRRDG